MENSFKKITAVLTAAALVGSFGIVAANAAAAQADNTAGALATPQINETWCVNDGVEISWDAVPGAYEYRVFYLNRSGNWRGMGNTKETHFLDDEVSSGSTYTYTVRCIDEKGNFVSDYDHTGFQGTYIAPPVLTETESVNEGVKISWEAPKGGTKFRVFYKGASGQWRSMGDTTETSFIDEGRHPLRQRLRQEGHPGHLCRIPADHRDREHHGRRQADVGRLQGRLRLPRLLPRQKRLGTLRDNQRHLRG